jgi:hypothetical protein
MTTARATPKTASGFLTALGDAFQAALELLVPIVRPPVLSSLEWMGSPIFDDILGWTANGVEFSSFL